MLDVCFTLAILSLSSTCWHKIIEQELILFLEHGLSIGPSWRLVRRLRMVVEPALHAVGLPASRALVCKPLGTWVIC